MTWLLLLDLKVKWATLTSKDSIGLSVRQLLEAAETLLTQPWLVQVTQQL